MWRDGELPAKSRFEQVHRTSFDHESNLVKCMVRRLTAREKLVEGRKSASMYPACFVEMSLLAMMRYAAYLSFETPRPGKGHLSKQASGAPF